MASDSPVPPKFRSRFAALGPGLLFAGAAVGVSHLVQSTRGGAEFGLAALLVVVLSCLLKWPAFRAGPLYAAATGNSLLDGYRRRGRWTLLLFAAMTLAICFTTVAAVTMVTMGLLISLIPSLGGLLAGLGLPGAPELDVAWASLAFIGVVGVAIATGGYRLLERAMKVVMPVLAICTITAAAIAMPTILDRNWSLLPDVSTESNRSLIAAIVGWMPAPIDIAVWSSLWTLAKTRTSRSRSGTREVLVDFDVGYFGTLVLAACFVILGAAVMNGSGVAFSQSSAEFGGQVVSLYAENLGEWTRPFVGTAAFLAMLSTTVTVADGFPRVIAALLAAAFGPIRSTRQERDPNVVPSVIRRVLESTMDDVDKKAVQGDAVRPDRGSEGGRITYWMAFVAVAAGAGVILFRVVPQDFKRLVDFVTITSFLIAPVLVLFNHLCVTGPEMPESSRPGIIWRGWSWLCFLVTLVFALWYLLDLSGLLQLESTVVG
ncbi:MAG: divalent metal cation transporter [Phycisphaera sp.]|nr:divalent metal cation transporter [Phycisphaera sp.]